MSNRKRAASAEDSWARQADQVALGRLAEGGGDVEAFWAFVAACQEAHEASGVKEVIDRLGVSPLALDCAVELFKARLRGLLLSCQVTGAMASLCTEQPERLRAVIAALQSARRKSG